MTDWQNVQNILHQARATLLMCHDYADPDALNSILAMALYLQQHATEFSFLYPANLPNKAYYLDDGFRLESILIKDCQLQDFDALVVVDTGAAHLLGAAEKVVWEAHDAQVPVILIDHHLSNDRYGTINLINTELAANCEWLYVLFRKSNVNITPPIAHALLGGIMGDTVKLSTSSVTAETLRHVADLMELGADKNRILEAMPTIENLAMARLWGQLLQATQRAGTRGEIAYNIIEEDLYNQLDYGSIAGLSSFLRDIGGIAVSLVFMQTANSIVKVEFRSVSGVNIRLAAEAFGGGGHRNAAGCRIMNKPLEQVIKEVVSFVSDLLG